MTQANSAGSANGATVSLDQDDGSSTVHQAQWAVDQARAAVGCRQAKIEKTKRDLNDALEALKVARAELAAAEEAMENGAG